MKIKKPLKTYGQWMIDMGKFGDYSMAVINKSGGKVLARLAQEETKNRNRRFKGEEDKKQE